MKISQVLHTFKLNKLPIILAVIKSWGFEEINLHFSFLVGGHCLKQAGADFCQRGRSWLERCAFFNLREPFFDLGSTQFPYNPLTMRMLSSTPPTSIACAPPSMSQATTHQQNRIWEREPAPLLSAQYETLSDSDD